MTFCYCPKCSRKLFFGEIEKLEGFINFRCPRCKTDCVLGKNPHEKRPYVIVTTKAEAPRRIRA